MSQATLNQPHTDAHVARLDYSIAQLENKAGCGREPLLEHLKSARTYLLGAMPEEYSFSLEYAKQALPGLSDEPLRRKLGQALTDLLSDASSFVAAPGEVDWRRSEPRAPAPGESASDLCTFFKGPITAFGVFYPKKYVIAILRSYAEARAACMALRNVGFGERRSSGGPRRGRSQILYRCSPERRPVGYPDDRGLPFH